MKKDSHKEKEIRAIVDKKPADMHGDGVYFNEELLAKKQQKELQKEKIKKQSQQKKED